MANVTKADEIRMVRRTYERKLEQANANIERHAEAIISGANDVLRNLQDGLTVYDFHNGQSVGDLATAINERKSCYEFLNMLDFLETEDKTS